MRPIPPPSSMINEDKMNEKPKISLRVWLPDREKYVTIPIHRIPGEWKLGIFLRCVHGFTAEKDIDVSGTVSEVRK